MDVPVGRKIADQARDRRGVGARKAEADFASRLGRRQCGSCLAHASAATMPSPKNRPNTLRLPKSCRAAKASRRFSSRAAAGTRPTRSAMPYSASAECARAAKAARVAAIRAGGTAAIAPSPPNWQATWLPSSRTASLKTATAAPATKSTSLPRPAAASFALPTMSVRQAPNPCQAARNAQDRRPRAQNRRSAAVRRMPSRHPFPAAQCCTIRAAC